MFSKQRIPFFVLSALVTLLLPLTGIGVFNVAATPFCNPAVNFDSSNFSNPTRINNRWLPFIPGTQLTLEGSTSVGVHRVVFTVTDLTKVIDGVRTVVIWDRDFDGSQLAEAELSFFAQDNDGNVWNLGEYPEVYEGGKFVGAPDTWIAGVDGAEGGIHMLTKPKTGTGEYLQGWSPTINFLDCAKVFKTGEEACVPVDCYGDVLVTSERSPLDRGGGHQLKYHAPGVGIVQIGAVGDPQAETLVLTHLVYLSPGELAQAREDALKLDKRGCRVSDVYRQTC